MRATSDVSFSNKSRISVPSSTLLFIKLSTMSYISLKKKKDLIRILICCHTMILYTWKYNLKIPYSQVSRVSHNYKEGKEMFPNLLNLSWLTTSKFSFYGELPTLTFWELKPNSAWGSLTLLDEVLNNLNYGKARLAWHKTAERGNSEGQSQSSGWWRSRLPLNLRCLRPVFTTLTQRSEMQL